MWIEIFWFCSISIATSFGFLVGTWVTAKRTPIDTSALANARRHGFIVGWRSAGRSKPDLVLISPTETRAVKSWPELIGSGNPEAHDYGAGLR
jgi:hypothetical protein